MAEEYSKLGKQEDADSLYAAWLKEDPTWSWGWIGWSDCYHLHRVEKDFAKAERILKEGLAVSGVGEKGYMLGRLADVYKETGRDNELTSVLR